MRIAIVGGVSERAGRPVFAAIAGDVPGLVELDTSAVSRLAGVAIGDGRMTAIEDASDRVEAAAMRLYASGCVTKPECGGAGWHLLVSALDLD